MTPSCQLMTCLLAARDRNLASVSFLKNNSGAVCMGRITFIEHNGTEHVVEIEEGKSLMETAVENGVPGIDADCGGACACGTCHVIVDKNWIQATGEIFANEEGMLSMTPEKTDTSRLSCQVTVSESMDGMVVHFPEFQM